MGKWCVVCIYERRAYNHFDLLPLWVAICLGESQPSIALARTSLKPPLRILISLILSFPSIALCLKQVIG